jgi:hypothetical protein
VAGNLMQQILARADADALPCYLETHKEANVRIYERYGFGVVAQAGAAHYPGKIWAMTRLPKR